MGTGYFFGLRALRAAAGDLGQKVACPYFFLLLASTAFAQAQPDRFSASGYFRLAARPDWQGGNGRLGFSDLYGRLMNEGPYGMLELKLDVLQAPPDSTD